MNEQEKETKQEQPEVGSIIGILIIAFVIVGGGIYYLFFL